jgi:A/G-specific adenine glycosylase
MDDLALRLLDWYAHEARRLPWRGNPDPYAVWVSEIMLQQTRVDTVIPYFEQWMQRFPNVTELAEASEQDVLVRWEGLGYYSRARNLHKAAREVAEHYGGNLPEDRQALESLPGVGAYTAGAIASIAFGQDEAALDGNIRRVMARLFAVDLPAGSREAESRLGSLAEEHLPAGRAGDYNQALMDLGASLCAPKLPACPQCPLNGLCMAFKSGNPEKYPLKTPRKQVPHVTVAAAILTRPVPGWEGKVLIQRRPENGLLGGLWEFPGGKQEDGESLEEALARELREELAVEVCVGEFFGAYKHAFTHLAVTLHAFRCTLTSGEPQPLAASQLAWADMAALGDYPMGKIDRRISDQLNPILNSQPNLL